MNVAPGNPKLKSLLAQGLGGIGPASRPLPAGYHAWETVGLFAGATATLALSTDNLTWTDLAGATMTAPGTIIVTVPDGCIVRMEVRTPSATTAVSATLALLAPGRKTRAFKPSDYGAALLAWWDVTDDAACVLEAGNVISRLLDKSGNGYHATALTTADRPGVNTQIGTKRALIGDGVNKKLTLDKNIIMPGLPTFLRTLSANTLYSTPAQSMAGTSGTIATPGVSYGSVHEVVLVSGCDRWRWYVDGVLTTSGLASSPAPFSVFSLLNMSNLGGGNSGYVFHLPPTGAQALLNTAVGTRGWAGTVSQIAIFNAQVDVT